MAETLVISGPTEIAVGGSATYTITLTGLGPFPIAGIYLYPSGSGSYWGAPAFGADHDGDYPATFTPPLVDATFDVYCYDIQNQVESNHLTVVVGGGSDTTTSCAIGWLRALSDEWKSYLSNRCLRLAACVLVKRTDGARLGFTTHDRPLTVGDTTYEALGSVSASALRQELGTGIDNLELLGLLSSDHITETDLRAGLYDNAELTLFLVRWDDLSLGPILLLRGLLGELEVQDGQYKAQVRSLMQRLGQQIGELTSPLCRVQALGDSRCKVNLLGNTADGDPITSDITLDTITSPREMTFSGGVPKNGFYTQGQLKITSGPNAGISREVKQHGDTDGPDGQTIASSPSNPGSIGFDNDAASASVTFAIPDGDWAEAILTIGSTWTRIGDSTGADVLSVEIPNGQNDANARQTNTPGTYSDVLTLGTETLAAVNAAAGSTVSLGLKHSSPGSSGANMNVSVTSASLELTGVVAGTSVRIVLQEAFPFPLEGGETATIIAGCDRRLFTCIQKFDNVVNFRGEPYLPGIDRFIKVGRQS